ncbi:MAG: tyrosine-type recombinase/integrase [Muribaculaceae bacterium]|nr:tyrosine-type recombinase/integrase [Muribaculaceae bacterium]
MAKKDKKDIKQVIADALERYHKMKPSIKDSTKRQNESLLSEFYRFVDTLRERERTMKIFTQKGLNRYKEYLIDKMERSKTDGKKRNFGVGQLNRCGSIIARLINNVLYPKEIVPNHVVWIKVEDSRREDQKGHFPLLDNEVTAIENCSGLTPVEEEYRDIFLLQIECGQRVSDLAKILTGKYRVKQGKKYKYIIISTIKENIKAHIPLRPKMRMWMEKVNSHKLITPVKFEKRVNGKGNGTYNQAIRRIVKKAGLDREIVRIDSVLLEVRGPLYEEITNHAARCTFITNMLKKGVSTERLSKMTGHASDEMIKRVYAQLTEDDEINLIESDLYSDVDDDEAPMEELPPTTIAPQKNAAVHEAEPSPFISDLPNYNQTVVFDRDNYIKGLEDVVETALTKAESMRDVFILGLELFNRLGEKQYRKIKKRLKGNCPKSVDDAREFWKKILIYCDKATNGRQFSLSYSKGALESIIKHFYLLVLIENAREKQIGEEVVLTLEKFLERVSEESPLVKHMNLLLPNRNIIIPAIAFLLPIAVSIRYALYNRPYVDSFLESEDQYTLNRIPNWALVHRELRKFPPLKLEALIQNTDCPQDVKITLYGSIVSGDVNLFASTIQKYDRQSHEIIELAYIAGYFNQMIEALDKLTNPNKNTFFSSNAFDIAHDLLLTKNPFRNLDPKMPDSVGHYLSMIDNAFRMIEQLKKRAIPSEIKVYNSLLERIDSYPELKNAYEDYKSEENSQSDIRLSDESNNKEELKVAFQDLDIFNSESNFSELKREELLSSINSDILKQGEGTFKEFINFLVYSGCIDDDDSVKQLMAYRFTGKCRPKGDLEKIPWNPDKLNELAYVIRHSSLKYINGKYKKARDFFEGPKFPANISIIRTYADNAPLEFRLKLHELYPKMFPKY